MAKPLAILKTMLAADFQALTTLFGNPEAFEIAELPIGSDINVIVGHRKTNVTIDFGNWQINFIGVDSGGSEVLNTGGRGVLMFFGLKGGKSVVHSRRNTAPTNNNLRFLEGANPTITDWKVILFPSKVGIKTTTAGEYDFTVQHMDPNAV